MTVLSSASIALSQFAAPLAFAPPPDGEGGGNPFVGLLPLILIMAIFYFLVIRPQQKRHKEHQQMVQSLSRGDRVLTNGGLYATVQDVHDDKLVVVISEGVKVEVAKNSVSGVVAGKGKKGGEDKKAKAEKK